MPGGPNAHDSGGGEADEHSLGIFWLAGDPEQHDTEADQDPGEVRSGRAEGTEESLSEQQVDHLQRRIPGRILPAKVARFEEVDHFPGRWLVLLRLQELQEQVATAEASDDIDSVA